MPGIGTTGSLTRGAPRTIVNGVITAGETGIPIAGPNMLYSPGSSLARGGTWDMFVFPTAGSSSRLDIKRFLACFRIPANWRSMREYVEPTKRHSSHSGLRNLSYIDRLSSYCRHTTTHTIMQDAQEANIPCRVDAISSETIESHCTQFFLQHFVLFCKDSDLCMFSVGKIVLSRVSKIKTLVGQTPKVYESTWNRRGWKNKLKTHPPTAGAQNKIGMEACQWVASSQSLINDRQCQA